MRIVYTRGRDRRRSRRRPTTSPACSRTRSSRGRSRPGTVLRQEQLSERFAVSRTPVREALRRLAALGLVSFEPNRGVRVRSISPLELREAFLVRAQLEGARDRGRDGADDARRPRGARGGRANVLGADPRAAAAGGAGRARRGVLRPVDAGQLRLPRGHLPGRRACRTWSGSRRPRGGRSSATGSGAPGPSSTSSTRGTSCSTAPSSGRSRPGAPRAAGELAREHVLASGRLIEAVLDLAREP